MNPRELIRSASERFRAAGIPDPENDAALLLAHLTGRPRLGLRLDEETVLDGAVVTAFLKLAEKRLTRFPLQYILGEAPFFRRVFRVDPRVLIPRPETELLCEWALEIMKGMSSPRVLDLCCGSGCIGLTLKAERPDAAVTLSDVSAGALEVAASNACAFSLDVELRCADLLSGYEAASFDLIVSNPPYIPSGDCDRLQPEVLKEPRLALDGGRDGCDLYRRISAGARTVLVHGGRLLLEIGSAEGVYLSDLLARDGFTGTVLRKDYGGLDRMLLAVNP